MFVFFPLCIVLSLILVMLSLLSHQNQFVFNESVCLPLLCQLWYCTSFVLVVLERYYLSVPNSLETMQFLCRFKRSFMCFYNLLSALSWGSKGMLSFRVI